MSDNRSGTVPDIAAILRPDSFERIIRGCLEHAAEQGGQSGAPSPAVLTGGGVLARIGATIIQGLRAARRIVRKRRP
jgi:hypothetical protein